MNLVERLKKHFLAQSNVLLTGAHGVGKTSIIKKVFEENGLVLNESWLYFSGSTLDPWVDFIGIPKEIEYNGRKCIEIIPPKAFAEEGKIQAIFIDEFNRSPSKIRNALLELCQFKSINGRKFPNLKVVWAAINPEDEEKTYDVERLDPAQKDRFPGNQIFVPYACDIEYFKSKYGKDIATASINWWNELPENIKKQVSPRRLDYALEYMSKDIPLEDILPKDSNISKLRQDLSNGPIDKKLSNLYETQGHKEAKLFLSVENNYLSAIKLIANNKNYIKFFVPLLKKEKICLLISDETMNISDYILENKDEVEVFKQAVESVLTASTNPKALMKIRSYYAENTNKNYDLSKLSTNFTISPLSNKAYIDELNNSNSKNKINVVISNFPENPDAKSSEETMKVISEFISNRWLVTIKQHNLNIVSNVWNKSYDNVDVVFVSKLVTQEMKEKWDSIGFPVSLKGV